MFTLVGLFFLVIGLGMAWIAVRSRRRAAAAAGWPSVEGTVLDAQLHVEESYDSEDGRTTYYRPDVTYAYEVAGQTYEGRRLDFRSTAFKNTDRRGAEEAVARYAAGTRVPVHYDPERPEEAVLERTAAGGTLLLVMGGLFALVGLALLVLG